MDNTKVHPGLLLWMALMYLLVSPDTECDHQAPHSLPSSLVSHGGVRTNMSPGADPGPGKTGGMSTELTIFIRLWNCWLIVQRYPPVDFPASVLLLSSLLLVCEALRFPGDGSPDVTNDYDDADNRIDDDVPDELQMATKIDVRDTQQLRGEIYRLQRLAFVLKWMCGVDLATPGYCKLKFTI